MSSLVQIGTFNFRFECVAGCTNCCTHPGDVFLTELDTKRIAHHLGLSTEEFFDQHCEKRDGKIRIADPAKEACRFVTATGCSIHAVKPLQCRTFPYWPEYVSSKRSWKNLRYFCPGIGVGPIIPLSAIRSQAQVALDAFPEPCESSAVPQAPNA